MDRKKKKKKNKDKIINSKLNKVANKCFQEEINEKTPKKKIKKMKKFKNIIISFNNLTKNIGLVNQK
jgi:hypothetical protein